MGVAAPLALLGLAAVAIPFVIHRLRRKDLPVRPLPTVAFLRQAQVAQRRRRDLSDLLLLAVRALLIAVACFAVAAPYVMAQLSFGDGRTTSLSIILDDSMSMGTRDGGEMLLARAIDRAGQVIETLPAGSEVSVVLASKPARLLSARTDDTKLAEGLVRELPVRPTRATDLPGAVRLASQQLAAAKHDNRTLLVLSDFARHVRLDRVQWPGDGARIGVEPVRAASPFNIALSSVVSAPDPGDDAKTSVSVELRGYGDHPEQAELAIVHGDGTMARDTVALSPAGAARSTLSVATPAAEANPTAWVELRTGDPLPADDRAGVLLRATNDVQVLVVNGDPRPARHQDEVRSFVRALQLAPASELVADIKVITPAALAAHDLIRTDVLVLANVRAPDEQTAERLTRFVTGGGGLLVTAGHNIDPPAYNARLDRVLPGRLTASPAGEVSLQEPEDPARALSIGLTGLQRTRVSRRILVEGPSRVALAFSDGTPAVAVQRAGKGVSALLATTVDADWSDLPHRPGFLALAAELVRFVAGSTAARQGAVQPGAVVELIAPPTATRLEVVDPTAERHVFEDIEAGKVEFRATERIGPYRVWAGESAASLQEMPRSAFVVAPAARESDLTPGPIPELPSAAEAKTGGSMVRRSLAPHAFLLVALLAITEGLLRTRRR